MERHRRFAWFGPSDSSRQRKYAFLCHQHTTGTTGHVALSNWPLLLHVTCPTVRQKRKRLLACSSRGSKHPWLYLATETWRWTGIHGMHGARWKHALSLQYMYLRASPFLSSTTESRFGSRTLGVRPRFSSLHPLRVDISRTEQPGHAMYSTTSRKIVIMFLLVGPGRYTHTLSLIHPGGSHAHAIAAERNLHTNR